MKKRYIAILLLILAVAVGVIIGRTALQPTKWREKARQAEKLQAEAEGQLVAERGTAADLRRHAADLDEQIEALEAAIGEPVEIRTVTRTRSNPINVDLQRLVGERGRRIDDLNATIRALNLDTGSECPECPGLAELFDVKQFQFDIGDMRVESESEAGNLFLTGYAELFLVAPEDMAGFLGTAEYRRDVTEFVASEAIERPRGQRWYAGLHYAVQVRSRDVPLADYIFNSVPNTITARFTPDRFRGYAGVRLFPLKARSYRLGVFADSDSQGIDVGISF